LSQVLSDDGATFVCCGLNERPDDPFRHCFKSETTDTMYDHDRRDLIDIIHVLSGAMAAEERVCR